MAGGSGKERKIPYTSNFCHGNAWMSPRKHVFLGHSSLDVSHLTWSDPTQRFYTIEEPLSKKQLTITDSIG
jgi:hypothetical protein